MNWLSRYADRNPVLNYVSHRRCIDDCLFVLAATCKELHSPDPEERVFTLPALRWSDLCISQERVYTVYDLVLAVTYLTEHGLAEERCHRTPDNTGFMPPYTEEYENALTVTPWRLEDARRRSQGAPS